MSDGKKDPKKDETASLPGEDLEALGIEAPNLVYALLIVWASQEWSRLGECAFARSLKHWLSMGRGPESPGGYRRLVWAEQRMGEHTFMPPIATSTTSADQLLVKGTTEGLDLDNIGKYPMFIDGRQVARASVKEGQLITVRGQFLLQCVRRPLPMPPPKHLHTRFMGRFGEANPFGFVGESLEAGLALDDLAYVAKRPHHVLLEGQTGTGKESAARMVHAMGPNPDAPFVAISAANLPDSLLQDMLFGHVADYPQKGMPATKGAIGAADGGTLFIDEIGRLSQSAQDALLRVLATGDYWQLGAGDARKSRFRLIGATSGPQIALIRDLLKRLVSRVYMPTLAARRDDIPLLVRHLLRKENPELTRHLLRKQVDGTDEVVPPVTFIEELMRRPDFDGNVRDLEHAVEKLLKETAPPQNRGGVKVRIHGEEDASDSVDLADDPDEARGRNLPKTELEWALGKHDGNVTAAARELKISRQSLYRAMERLGVKGKGG